MALITLPWESSLRSVTFTRGLNCIEIYICIESPPTHNSTHAVPHIAPESIDTLNYSYKNYIAFFNYKKILPAEKANG